LILANDLGYGDTSQLAPVLEEVSRMLEAYMNSMRRSVSTGF
jgi:hypothetical protein